VERSWYVRGRVLGSAQLGGWWGGEMQGSSGLFVLRRMRDGGVVTQRTAHMASFACELVLLS
jgi:hypothetical protein